MDARLRALHLDAAEQRILLFFHEATLAVRLSPRDAGVLLYAPSDPIPLSRAFASTLLAIDAPADDRVLTLDLRAKRAPRERRRIVLELLGHQSNALVLQEDGRIRHALRTREGQRPVGRGLQYLPPPSSAREGVDGSLSLERWMGLLLEEPPDARRATLLAKVAWSSSVNARALLGAAARESGPGAEYALKWGHDLWLRLALVARDGSGTEAVLMDQAGRAQPYPLPLPGEPGAPHRDLLAAFAAAADSLGRAGAPQVPGAWLESLEARIARARSRAQRLVEELKGSAEPDALRAAGDLLLARYHDIPRGVSTVTLPDFEGVERRIALDARLSTHENAARYYERAARSARARERLPSLIDKSEREALELEALLERARAGAATPDEVLAVLPGTLPSSTKAAPTLPYRRYRSSGGLEIRVGKGAKHNDALTFQHSSPDDVWLHARHASGAHVVLRWQGTDAPPARDLMEAAILAALHSRARTSASVPVDWTRRKYVHKPRKAPPGAVRIERSRTLFVEPDSNLEDRLKEEGAE